MSRVCDTPDVDPRDPDAAAEHVIEGIKQRYVDGEIDEAELETRLESAFCGDPDSDDVAAGLQASHSLLDGGEVCSA